VKEVTDDELPEGWAKASVASLIAADGLFSDGDWVESKDQDPNGSIRLLQLADIGDGIFIDKSNRFINEEKFELLRCTEVLEGDLLIARMPDPLGRACLAPKLPQKSITVVDVAIVRPGKESVLPRWLMHWVNSPDVRAHIELESSGTTRKRIARGKLAEIELPIAPRAEQKRIADKLAAVLGRVDACRARLPRVSDLLKRFRQSILADATSGRLTEEWRNLNGVNDKWGETEIQHVGHISTGSTPSKKEASNYGSDFPFVKPGDLDKGEIFQTEDGLSKAGFKLSRQLRKGAVLVSCIGNLGKVGIAGRPLACNQQINAIEFDQRVVTDRFGYYFAHTLKEWLEENASATTIAIINKGRFSVAPIAIPSLPEQQEIVRRVEALFAFADRIEARLTAVLAQVERLTPATLAKAFRGELVPQNPNDEPASVLLQRLLTARKIEAGRPKHKRAAHKRIMKPSTQESIRDVILSMKKDTFNFSELREAVQGDYEALTEAVFRLLAEEKPILKQVFNTKAKIMQFQRSKT
jgi:type I restriction enzyme, S subunit